LIKKRTRKELGKTAIKIAFGDVSKTEQMMNHFTFEVVSL